jgi:trk system potassium uptake protein TrkH
LGLAGAMGNYFSLPIPAKWILIVEMMLGRLEFYAVLIVLSRSFWKK